MFLNILDLAYHGTIKYKIIAIPLQVLPSHSPCNKLSANPFNWTSTLMEDDLNKLHLANCNGRPFPAVVLVSIRRKNNLMANGFKEKQWEPNQIVILTFLFCLLLFINFQFALNDHQVRYAHTIFLALRWKHSNQ